MPNAIKNLADPNMDYSELSYHNKIASKKATRFCITLNLWTQIDKSDSDAV